MSSSDLETHASAASNRSDWIDVAKAIAILLIVVYHVTAWYAGYVAPTLFDHRSFTVWRELSRALVPVRIPLFFLVSGLLAQRAIARPWPDLARSRFATPLWVFALWTVLIAGPWSVRVAPDDRMSNLAMVAQSLAFGGTHFWYLPALVIFLCAARLLRRRPAIALGASAIASFVAAPVLGEALAGLGPVLGANIERILIFAVWFFIGCFAPAAVEHVAAARARWLPVAVGAFLGLWLLVPLGGPLQRVVVPAITLSGVIALLLLSRLLARFDVVRRIGRYVAERTLAVYVVHAFALELLAIVVWRAEELYDIALPMGTVTAVLFVPATFTVLVAASLGLHALTRRLAVPGVLVAPASLTALPGRR